MNKTICNIPHSGNEVPDWALKDIIISREAFSDLAEFMIDKDIDKIWGFVPEEDKIIASYSRLILDIERFRNDADEPMSLKGMGLYYTHGPDGRQFRNKTSYAYKKCLEHYDAYHRALEKLVEERLERYGVCTILDCHSFHDRMNYTGYSPENFPDVCIGVNGDCISPEIQIVIDAFSQNGYSIKVNEPFAGALVPLMYLDDRRVRSVMIELNRRIYDNADFERVKAICREIYSRLNKG